LTICNCFRDELSVLRALASTVEPVMLSVTYSIPTAVYLFHYMSRVLTNGISSQCW